MLLPLSRTTLSLVLCSSGDCISRQFPLRFSSAANMIRGGNGSGRERGSISSSNSAIPRDPVEANGSSPQVPSGVKISQAPIESQTLKQKKAGDKSKENEYAPVSQNPGSISSEQWVNTFNYEEEFPPLSETISSTFKNRNKNKHKMRTKIELSSEDRGVDSCSVRLESSPLKLSTSLNDESSLPTHFGKKGTTSRGKRPKHFQFSSNKASDIGISYSPEGLPLIEPFDICQSDVRSKLYPHVKEEKYYNQLEPSMEGVRQLLRPGMVLLKSYITISEQIEILKKCRDLGLGPGGFYRPSYRDGAKLRLQMMCLGLNWELQTRKYENPRSVDGAEPPKIPQDFSLLVERAIRDSHALINEEMGVENVEDILPRMSPDICIVNFYTTSGRLGLHQDRDESKESLDKGLPVVSISIGDSAEFLYGDQRDVDKAEEVILESGDILIFGGRSRHIFHGVTSIFPDSAPLPLVEEANLRPGRLNLTFRQY